MGKSVHRVKWVLAAFLLSAITACAWGADEQNCRLKRYVSWPIALDQSGWPIVSVPINGKPQNMLIDTGAFYSILRTDTVKRLGLPQQVAPEIYLVAFGGERITHVAIPKEVMVGTIPLRKHPFFVGDFPDSTFDGLLGAEFTSFFDVDFDFAAGTVNLFSPDHCPGRVVYWTNAQVPALDFKNVNNAIRVDVTIAGRSEPAAIDTGSTATVMSLETAADLLGMAEDKLRILNDQGKADTLFKSLSFQNVTINNPVIRLVSNDDSKVIGHHNEIKIVIGMNVLRQLHLYIAYKEKKLYVTPAVIPQPKAP